MAALPGASAFDVFHVERRRLEEAAADLRNLLAEKNEELSERCAKCAHEEEKLMRSKYLSEFKEISLQKDIMKTKLEKNTNLEEEMDLTRAEQRKKAVEEYQSHLRLTEGSRNDLLARIGQLKAKQRGATESLKSQMCRLLETHQKQEATLSQKLRGQEEALARNEAAADALQGMTLQEYLAADLKQQLFASQEKVATLEASVESMQALTLQKNLQVEEMIQACDTDLKQKASQRDTAERENLELQKREEVVKAATSEIKRLQEADSFAKDLQEKLHTSGLIIPDVRSAAAAVCQDKAPEDEWICEKMKLQAQIAASRRSRDKMEAEIQKLGKELRIQRSSSELSRTGSGEISTLSECEMQAKELRSRISQLQSDPNAGGKDGQLQALDAKGRRLRMLSSMVQDMPHDDL